MASIEFLKKIFVKNMFCSHWPCPITFQFEDLENVTLFYVKLNRLTVSAIFIHMHPNVFFFCMIWCLYLYLYLQIKWSRLLKLVRSVLQCTSLLFSINKRQKNKYTSIVSSCPNVFALEVMQESFLEIRWLLDG